jgi:hypothetical protein
MAGTEVYCPSKTELQVVTDFLKAAKKSNIYSVLQIPVLTILK